MFWGKMQEIFPEWVDFIRETWYTGYRKPTRGEELPQPSASPYARLLKSLPVQLLIFRKQTVNSILNFAQRLAIL